MQYNKPTVQQLSLVHILIQHTDYKIFVIERAGFGNEFFIMLTRPEIMTTMSECGALWHIVMQYMFAFG